MVPHTSVVHNANREDFDEDHSVKYQTGPWEQAASLPPPSQSTPAALSPFPSQSDHLAPVSSLSHDEILSRPRHHCRNLSSSTRPTRTTLESRRRRTSSKTSISSHRGTQISPESTSVDNAHRFFCPKYGCDQTFERTTDQKRHVSHQHAGKGETCVLCQCKFKRPYTHKICGGIASVFDSAPWVTTNNYGCGLCLSYFRGFNDWIHHVQKHQKGTKKLVKADWNISLELRSLLQNHVLASTLAYESSSIAIPSMTWSDENYHEAKSILETIELPQSFERLPTVFDLASDSWPASNHLTASMIAEAPGSSIADGMEMTRSLSSSSQAPAAKDLPFASANVEWRRSETALQQTELLVEGLGSVIAGVAEPSFSETSPEFEGGSQPSVYSSGGYFQPTDDGIESPNDTSGMSDAGNHSYFDEAFAQ